jgi:integrase
MTALAERVQPLATDELEWARLAVSAPKLAATARRYLGQIEVSLRPSSIKQISLSLRQFCRHLVAVHPDVQGFSEVGRIHVESYKLALAHRRTAQGTPLSVNTLRMRLGMVLTFFDRIIEWGYEDAPVRTPVFISDIPRPEELLPKALDDAQAARFMREVAREPDQLRRLVLEILSRTGLRVGELLALEKDAVTRRSGGYWLKVPVGKLRNDRTVPLLPPLIDLLADWQATHGDAGTGLLLTNTDGQALTRHVVTRMVNRVAKRAGIGHVHPHQLRHTLATQAVNRGMRLESIAELLGHRTLRMTIRYARIANKTVADEFRAAAEKVDALYAEQPDLPETPAMRRLRLEHRRMLGNGWCTRPAELDCSFESLCEGCGFFATTVEFKDTLTAQRDHAAAHGQTKRRVLYQGLVDGLENKPGAASEP